MTLPGFDRILDVDDIPEFHVARLLILLRIAGRGNTGLIRGRMKLAKLDFFLRYPRFLEVAIEQRRSNGVPIDQYTAESDSIESSMVRYRYGPWDHRYYNLLAYMTAKNLIHVGGGSVDTYSLTDVGREVADRFVGSGAFAPLVQRAKVLEAALAMMTGTELRDFVYDVFGSEVGDVALGTVIR